VGRDIVLRKRLRHIEDGGLFFCQCEIHGSPSQGGAI
jgi:hypothetical protein